MNGLRVLLRRSREELIKSVEKLVQKLVERYGERIVGVFIIGSVARNTHGPRSDVDLVLVMSNKNAVPYVDIKKMTTDIVPVPTDIIVLDLGEYEKHATYRTRFYSELLRGIKVYWRSDREDNQR